MTKTSSNGLKKKIGCVTAAIALVLMMLGSCGARNDTGASGSAHSSAEPNIYKAYADILRENESVLKTDPSINDNALNDLGDGKIALADVNNDNVPELLYISFHEENNLASEILQIYTFDKSGGARKIFDNNVRVFAGGDANYCVFENAGGNLILYNTASDEATQYAFRDLNQYMDLPLEEQGETDAFDSTGTILYSQTDPIAPEINTYKVNNADVSKEAFLSSEEKLTSSVRKVFFCSGGVWSYDTWLKSEFLPSDCMTYAEAVSRLNTYAKEDADTAAKEIRDRENEKTANAAGQEPPDFTYMRASSTRTFMGDNNYFANNAFDGNLSTAWCEGVAGPGVGEWIELYSDKPQRVSKVYLTNGYCKSAEAYKNNNRLSVVTITGQNGFEMQSSLKDNVVGFQEIDFPKPLDTYWLRFTITDVYPGAADNEDMLISEIRIGDFGDSGGLSANEKWKAAYAPIFQAYEAGSLTGFSGLVVGAGNTPFICDAIAYTYKNAKGMAGEDKAVYAFMDIDGNGTDELLFGVSRPGKDNQYALYIFDIWTLLNNEPVRLMIVDNGQERQMVNHLGTTDSAGLFVSAKGYVADSSVVESSSYTIFSLNKNSINLTKQATFSCDPFTNNGSPIIYMKNSDEISRTEYIQGLKGYGFQMHSYPDGEYYPDVLQNPIDIGWVPLFGAEKADH